MIFRDWSNLVVEEIANLPENAFIRDFCSKLPFVQGLDFSCDTYKYHTNIWHYCMAVLPRPLKYLSTLTSELNWSEECIRIIDASERKPLFGEITKERKRNDTSKRQEKKSLTYPKEQRESLIRTEIRFSQFAKSFEYLKQFDIRFGESLKEYRKSNRREQLNLLTQSAIERKKEIRKPENKRSKLIEIDRLRLHQCVFCWRYRLNSSLEMQVSTEDESKWHCERSECAKAFGSWRKDLNSKDISLKDIGRREGF